ncbi:hypothetical protein N7540_003288 [Penicillium herquei]|nr:hypothetical protein N7540_003288 [Penicillium herquei]
MTEENDNYTDISHYLGQVVHRRLEIIEEEGKITLAHHTINVAQNIKKGFAIILSVKDFVTTAISSDPHASLAWAGVLVILPLLQRTITAQDDAIEGFNEISKILIRFRVMEELYFESPHRSVGSTQPHPRNELEKLVRTKTIDLYSQILEYQIRLAVYLSQKQISRLFKNLTGSDDWKSKLASINQLAEDIGKDFQVKDKIQWTEIDAKVTGMEQKWQTILVSLTEIREKMIESERAHLRDRLDKQLYAEGAAFNSNENQHGDCLENTRVDLLENILSWAHAEGDENIFWLKGVAGTGKSTIAHTVASTLFSQGHLVASFFFARGLGDRGHGKLFSTSIAFQIAEQNENACHHICTAIGEQPGIRDKDLSFQWQKLLREPFEKMEESIQPFLVIDAMDECESKNLDEIIGILTRMNKDSSGKHIFKIFITSRPETTISFGFQQADSKAFCELVLDKVSRDVVKQDIRTLIYYRMRGIRQRKKLQDSWPNEEQICTLVERADRLFIYAATICRYLERSPYPTRGLQTMLDAGDSVSSLEGIDKIYLQVLKSFVKEIAPEFLDLLWQNFREIIGSILVLLEPFNVASLSGLLLIDEYEVSLTLEPLFSILEIPANIEQPVKIFHQSFRDFLIREKRCEIAEQDGISESNFHINEESMHGMLAIKCLEAMSKTLRKNLCQASHTGISLSDIDRSDLNRILPKYVQYACCHWVYHLGKSRRAPTFTDEVSSFFRAHLLHWLEALSLLGKGPESAKYIKALQLLFVEESSGLPALLLDIKRIVLQNMSIIESAPLQLYSSALIFAPQSSIVRNIFQPEEVAPLRKLPRVDERWNSLLQTSNISEILSWSASWSAISLEFSANGELVAIACSKEIQIWDVESGIFLLSIPGEPCKMGFSPDNRKLAVTSSPEPDGVIRLWDTSTGILHTFAVYSSGNQAHIMDASSGSLRFTPLCHAQKASAVAFSHTGRLIASGSIDGTVNLWDSSTGMLQRVFKDYDTPIYEDQKHIRTVEFSPDDRLVLSSSLAGAEVWDTAGGSLKYTISGEGYCISVSFSPDGKLLAVQYKNYVEIHDSRTGNSLKAIYRDRYLPWDQDLVQSMKFFSDSNSIAIALEKSIDLWDLSPGFEQETQLEQVDLVAISLDGTFGASNSTAPDMTVKIWDISKEAVLHNLVVGSDRIKEIRFSPDKRLLLSRAEDDSLTLWDTSTGRRTHTLRPQCQSKSWLARIEAIKFSPDSQILSSAWLERDWVTPFEKKPAESKELQIHIWNTSTGTLLNVLRHPFDLDYLSVVFSPDGKIVAAAAIGPNGTDRRILLWYTESGSLIYDIEKEGPFPWLEFSPDGKILAYAVEHGVELCQLEPEMPPQNSAANCGLKDDTYNLWESGQARSNITISRDRKMIASHYEALDPSNDKIQLHRLDLVSGPLSCSCQHSESILKYEQRLSFIQNDQFIMMDSGFFFINREQHQIERTPASCSSQLEHYLSIEKDWIMFKNKRILWIPPSYRVKDIASHDDGSVIIGCQGGQVLIMHFDLFAS